MFDARNTPVSCSQRPALDLYEKALVQYQSYIGDPVATIEEALRHAPDFILGHLFRATLLVTLTEQRFVPQARASVDSAEALLSDANPRERGLIAAGRVWSRVTGTLPVPLSTAFWSTIRGMRSRSSRRT